MGIFLMMSMVSLSLPVHGYNLHLYHTAGISLANRYISQVIQSYCINDELRCIGICTAGIHLVNRYISGHIILYQFIFCKLFNSNQKRQTYPHMQCIDQWVQKQAHHFTWFSVKMHTSKKHVIIWHSYTPKIQYTYFIHTTTLQTAMIYFFILTTTGRAVGTGGQRGIALSRF